MTTSSRVDGADRPGRGDDARRHWVTLATIAILVVGVVGFRVHVGMGAFAAAVVAHPGEGRR